MGANQQVITTLSFTIITLFIYLEHANKQTKKTETQNLYLTLYFEKDTKLQLKKITTILKTQCTYIRLKKYYNEKNTTEIAFYIDLQNIQSFDTLQTELKKIKTLTKITYFDQEEQILT